jgi:hypothetical protein
MVFSGSSDSGQQYSYQAQHGLWTPSWPLTVVWATDITMAFGVAQTIDFGGTTGHRNQHIPWIQHDHKTQHSSWWQLYHHRYQHELRQQDRLFTSTSPVGATHIIDTNMVSRVSTYYDHPHEPRASTWPGAIAGSVTQRSSMNHGGPPRRSIPENEPFFILDILSLLRARVIMQLGSKLGD